jgi:hypothetical protein
MSNTFMLERMDTCANLWVEYMSNVWKLKFERRSAGSGTIYFYVKNDDGTMFFKVRIADHPPCLEDRDDPRQINVDPNREPISSLAYCAFRFGLKRTTEIEAWDSVSGYGPQDRTKPSAPSRGETIAVAALVAEVDNLTSRLKESEALNKSYVFEHSRLEHDTKKQKEALDALRASNAKLQAECDSIKAQVRRMSDAYNRFVKEFNG